MRFPAENLPAQEVMGVADERAIHLLPQVGAAWMPHGTQAEIMTPGQNAKPSLAGALQLATGTVRYGLGPRKNKGWLRDLLTLRDQTSPARQMTPISVVVENSWMPKAQAVEQWVASHPRGSI